MEENTQPIAEQAPVEETSSSFSFISDEEVAAMQQPQAPVEPAVQEQPTVEATPEVQQEESTRASISNWLENNVLNKKS